MRNSREKLQKTENFGQGHCKKNTFGQGIIPVMKTTKFMNPNILGETKKSNEVEDFPDIFKSVNLPVPPTRGKNAPEILQHLQLQHGV